MSTKNNINGISQLNLYKNFSKIDDNVFKKAGLSNEDIEWIKKRIAKNPKGFLFDFKELDKNNRLSNNYFAFKEIKELSINKKEKDNHLLIEGENYEALKALKATGTKVDIIYIDPPYNTGKEFIYSDDYSTNPKPVGNDDVHKHSKWLSFMKKRLILAKELLSDEGVIFISIDDNEQSYLKVLMDEIFGQDNFVSSISRKTSAGSKNDSEHMANSLDYILFYKKSILHLRRKILEVDEKKYNQKDDKTGKKFKLRALEMQGGDDTLDKRPNMGYSIYFNPSTSDMKVLYDYSRETFEYNTPKKELLEGGYGCYRPRRRGDKRGRWRWGDISKLDGNIVFKDCRVYSKEWMPKYIKMPYNNFWDGFLNTAGTNELKNIFNFKVFDFPKPTTLIKQLISMIDNRNALILDFFAGTGTTGQAVMELNKEDNGNRKFILVTNNERKGYNTIANPEYGIARAITRERLFRVINGKGTNGEKIKWELPKNLQIDDKKYLSDNSVNYLEIKTIHKVNGEFEEIDGLQPLYKREFNKDNFSIVELENE